MTVTSPQYSVIVPVRDGEDVIGACLDALRRQSVPVDTYETVVVDDRSRDGTRQVVGGFPEAHLVSGSGRGPAAARNLGVEHSGGRILLFTDADCVPAPRWIERLVAPLSDPAIAGSRGQYGCKQRSWTARFAQLEYEQKYRLLARDEYVDFVDTSAAAYRRAVFEQSGGFSEDFAVASGEDTDLSFRLARSGHKLVSCPDAIVFHRHPARLADYLRRKFKTAVWRPALYARHPGKMARDSHTPQTLKLQIALVYAAILMAAATAALSWPVWMAAVAPAIFLLSTVPFVVASLRSDPVVALVSPAFLALRSAAFAGGLPVGYLRLLTARRSGRGGD